MGFVFRIEKIDYKDQETLLTGYMISGVLDWHQRVKIQAGEELHTVFSGPLRGVARMDHEKENPLSAFDPTYWEHFLVLPLHTSKEKRICLVLHGVPSSKDLTVPAIALGIDVAAAAAAHEMQSVLDPPSAGTAIQTLPSSAVLTPPNLGTPVREYPYRFKRREILRFAPWLLLVSIVFLCGLCATIVINKRPLQQIDFGTAVGCGLVGLIDIFFLYFSVRMLMAKPSHLIVTTNGIVVPRFLWDFSSQDVFVSFLDMHDMLEHWHNDSVQMIKLKTTQGIYHVNGLLMQTSHFEELRRILWQRIHRAHPRQDDHSIDSLSDTSRSEENGRFAELPYMPPSRQ